jgi:S-formylglutathione hydrolase FrmB
MGGYGTLYYAFLHPEMFCYAYAMSPAIDVPGTPSINSLASDASPDGLPAITIDVGTEDFLVFSGADAFEKTLTKSGIKHDYITRPGTHDWIFWQEAIQTTLERMGTYLK